MGHVGILRIGKARLDVRGAALLGVTRQRATIFWRRRCRRAIDILQEAAHSAPVSGSLDIRGRRMCPAVCTLPYSHPRCLIALCKYPRRRSRCGSTPHRRQELKSRPKVVKEEAAARTETSQSMSTGRHLGGPSQRALGVSIRAWTGGTAPATSRRSRHQEACAHAGPAVERHWRHAHKSRRHRRAEARNGTSVPVRVAREVCTAVHLRPPARGILHLHCERCRPLGVKWVFAALRHDPSHLNHCAGIDHQPLIRIARCRGPHSIRVEHRPVRSVRINGRVGTRRLSWVAAALPKLVCNAARLARLVYGFAKGVAVAGYLRRGKFRVRLHTGQRGRFAAARIHLIAEGTICMTHHVCATARVVYVAGEPEADLGRRVDYAATPSIIPPRDTCARSDVLTSVTCPTEVRWRNSDRQSWGCRRRQWRRRWHRSGAEAARKPAVVASHGRAAPGSEQLDVAKMVPRAAARPIPVGRCGHDTVVVRVSKGRGGRHALGRGG
eukprot:7385837-Prymnesium_polylepis.1